MEAAVFFSLAYRLPAYQGAMAAAVARQRQDSSGPKAARRPGQQGQRELYERSSPTVSNARAADDAPPATASTFAQMNAQLGVKWFSHRVVTAAEIAAAGAQQRAAQSQQDSRPDLRTASQAEYRELRGGDT
jgi:hypothetical protein